MNFMLLLRLAKRKTLGFLRKYRLVIFNNKISIGDNFYSLSGCRVSRGRDVKIGDNFYMGHGCYLSCEAIIGDDVMFASGVALVGGDHKIDGISCKIRDSGRQIKKPIQIGNNVWVGHNAIILQGVAIEEGAVVAAGSVLTKDVEKNAIYAGNPAKLIRYRQS